MTRVYFFINKKIDQITWTYIIDGSDVISLNLTVPGRSIDIHNV